ncbi:hypothetical protein M752DRAFT_310069 [Aspergillus phoenicis ATCC 13157]|uniref:Sialidase domain-containing protein n=1 Tax=Aspergillus phoenicis ATCC 13157 TaxID=1353007 RepID=A0A370PWI5_ASPPH|nr:hypothetical protein M752DRAFT_310069 [Aspergillus phoenicis ATCC 13157]
MIFHIALFFFLRLTCTSAAALSHGNAHHALTQLWDVTPEIDYSDPLYAGWDPIPDVVNIEIYNGAHEQRTYALHPILYSRGEDVYLIHTSSVIDEDTMGQNIWMAHSHDGGYTWTESRPILPPAILPNQTATQTFKYYCDLNVQQRAFQSDAIVEHGGKLFAVAQTLDFWCSGKNVSTQDGSGKYASGRVARPLHFDGSFAGDPCWIQQNVWTDYVRYNETVYGTKYGMRYCEEASAIREILELPGSVPAWSDFQINSGIYAADNNHSMEEVTHAVWLEDVGLWQRFWRDISTYNSSHAVWVEYSHSGRDWFPVVRESYGNQIFETNIPDEISKQYLLRIPNQDLSALISNPRFNEGSVREPLTLATARGRGVQPFQGIGVLRTNASTEIASDTRGFKAKGFQYPSATQVGDNLIVAYSENKQNIWVSIVPVQRLP